MIYKYPWFGSIKIGVIPDLSIYDLETHRYRIVTDSITDSQRGSGGPLTTVHHRAVYTFPYLLVPSRNTIVREMERNRGDVKNSRRNRDGIGGRQKGGGRRTSWKRKNLRSFLRFNYFAGLLVHGCDIQRVYIYIHIYVYLYTVTDKWFVLRPRWARW